MFVVERKTAKEIAILLDVAQKTMGEWVKKYGWKEEREAKAISSGKRVENLDSIITGMAEKRIRLERLVEEEEAKPDPDMKVIEETRKEIVTIDYGVANWNKVRKNVEKESKISPADYYQVMDDIFQNFARYDYQLYLKTIDFQQFHIESVSTRKTIL